MQNSESVFLEDDEGNKIPYMSKDPKHFYRKIVNYYGETESGKSFLIQEHMYLLRKLIPNVIIFAPTNTSNNLYTGKIGKSGIFVNLTIDILEMLYERQKDSVKIYEIANNMEVMKSLFLKVADERTKAIVMRVIKDAKHHLDLAAQRYSDPGVRKSEEMKIKTMRDNELRRTFKLSIEANRRALLDDATLTADQYIATFYCGFSPDILLVFDDCASFFNQHKNEKVIKDMFYEGRHDAITSLFAFQGTSNIPPDLRRAAHVSIFTTQGSANAFVSCKENGIAGDRGLKRRFERAASRIFRSDNNGPCYRKLVYLRGNAEPIQTTLADSYDDFEMGGLWVKKLLKVIEPKTISAGNDKNLINKIYHMTKGKKETEYYR